MKRLLLLTILLNTVFLSAQQKINFGDLKARQIGPAVMSGRISTIDVLTSDTRLMYVGTAGGGVWKSSTAGTTFTPIFDKYIQSIGKIKIDQQRPDTVWVGTGEPWVRNSVGHGNGIYKTTNGGKKWKNVGLKETERIGDIIIHPNDPNTVYVAALGKLWTSNEERGVFKTTDGGKNWKKIFYIDEHTGATDLAIDPRNPDIMYAVMWSHRRYPHFFDSGNTLLDNYDNKSGIYKTTDGGNTWNILEANLPTSKKGRCAIAISPANPDFIYVTIASESTKESGMYLSKDSGNSFNKVGHEQNVTIRPFYFAAMTADPIEEGTIYKCGFKFIFSEDEGQSFVASTYEVHPDIHDIWIDPNNNKHVIVATDGGVFESLDKARTFRMLQNLPVSQFYHVSADTEENYMVYGGLQDNGSWYAPSKLNGGITNNDWKKGTGGDGFYFFRHPVQKDYLISEYQEGNSIRTHEKTGVAKSIKPLETDKTGKMRFNWNTPIHIGRNNPNNLYTASQFVFKSTNIGDSWDQISDDLTSNDSTKLIQNKTGGITLDKSSAENHCSVFAIQESPFDEKKLIVGTDDGKLWITKNAGKKWKEVAQNISDIPAASWFSYTEWSNHVDGRLYVSIDNHRRGDFKPQILSSDDFGKTWKKLGVNDKMGYVFVVKEDNIDQDVLYAGTSNGLWISLNRGTSFSQLKKNFPPTEVRDLFLQEKSDDLIAATHGRGIIIVDDLHLIRNLKKINKEEELSIVQTSTFFHKDPGSRSNSGYSGHDVFVGQSTYNYPSIAYNLKKSHVFGKMSIEIFDKNGLKVGIKPPGKTKGLNIVEMPTDRMKPVAPPSVGSSLYAVASGTSLAPGSYDVVIKKGKNSYKTNYTIDVDPNATVSKAERESQIQLADKLYDIIEETAYTYHVLEIIQKNSDTATQEKVSKFLKSFINQEGDFYVNEGEKQLVEKIFNLYGEVNSYPGTPNEKAYKRFDELKDKLNQQMKEYNTIVENWKSTGGDKEQLIPTKKEFLEKKKK